MAVLTDLHVLSTVLDATSNTTASVNAVHLHDKGRTKPDMQNTAALVACFKSLSVVFCCMFPANCTLQGTCGTCGGSQPIMIQMVISAAMSVTQMQGRYRCTVKVTVQDSAKTNLGKGITVSGQWARIPDNNPSDSWPYSASAKTAPNSIAALAANNLLPRNSATTCQFTVTAVDATAFAAAQAARAAKTAGGVCPVSGAVCCGLVKSRPVAKGCWNAAGTVLRSCP